MLSRKRLLKMSPTRCYVRLVTEDLLAHYDIGIRPAVIAVRCSRFYTALKSDPKMVMAETADEWAESIASQFNFRHK